MQLTDGCGEIAVIPAIESFEVVNAGIVTRASMTFPERATFVVRRRHAEGETTLITALCAAAGLPLQYGLPPITNGQPMSICTKWKHELRHARAAAYSLPKPPDAPMAEKTMAVLRDALTCLGKDHCLIVGSECFWNLDQRHLPDLIRLMTISACQLIAFLSVSRTREPLDAIKPSTVYAFVELADQPEHFRVEPSSFFSA
jgi:hypothetical protein